MTILVVCPLSDLDAQEERWIERLGTHKHGVNTTAGGKWNNREVQKGERNAYAKLTDADVRVVIEMLMSGVSQQRIASHFHVSRSCIAGISRGGNWTHLSGGVLDPGSMRRPRTGYRTGEDCGNAKLSNAEVMEIRQRYEPMAGVDTYSLAAEYSVSPNTVQRIVNGETWKAILPHGYRRAEQNTRPQARLTEADVLSIKERLRSGSRGIGAQLAREYGVSQMTISDIRRGVTWAS